LSSRQLHSFTSVNKYLNSKKLKIYDDEIDILCYTQRKIGISHSPIHSLAPANPVMILAGRFQNS
jgi:hypothetical protein